MSVQCIVAKHLNGWMRFGMVGRMGVGMRQIMGFGDRSTGRGNFGSKYGAPHCNQWGTFYYWEFPLRRCEVAAEFLELQARRAGEACRLSVQC